MRRAVRRQDRGPSRPAARVPRRDRPRRPRGRQPAGGCSACSRRQHDPRVERRARPATRHRPAALQRGQPAGQRAEPGGDDHEGARILEPRRQSAATGLLPPGRGRLDRQAGPRRQSCGQIGETVAFDKAIQVGARLRGQAPRHPGHRDGRPRPHEPDRQRRRQRKPRPDEHADREGRCSRPDHVRRAGGRPRVECARVHHGQLRHQHGVLADAYGPHGPDRCAKARRRRTLSV